MEPKNAFKILQNFIYFPLANYLRLEAGGKMIKIRV